MFVIIADQVDSRHDRDHVDEAIGMLTARFGEHLVLPPERTAGDELQLLVADGATALAATLALLRDDHWRAGLGLGPVALPLPAGVREASGPAFIAARAAIEAAERRPLRFAVRGARGEDAAERAGGPATIEDGAADIGAIIDLLLTQRARWSEQGWQLHDLLERGLTQGDAALELGITPQAASKRARAAGLRVDADARASIGRLLDAVGRTSDGEEGAAAGDTDPGRAGSASVTGP